MLKILKLILLLYFSFNFSYANEINTKVDQITKNLRCLICQGQSVYDSQSDFAISMKLVVKNKIDEGKEDEEIYDYLKNKYGEWILATLLLEVRPVKFRYFIIFNSYGGKGTSKKLKMKL